VYVQAGAALSDPDVAEFFTRLIMKCVPKSHTQAMGEVRVTAAFLHNFGGDNVRRLAKSFGVSGDYYGQVSTGYRWPYGPVCIVTPFNFPLEIPVLQLMGAVFMGNKPLLKPSEQVSIVMEQFLRLILHCGMTPTDIDFMVCPGPTVQSIITADDNNLVRVTQFTGSSRIGELLSEKTRGKVKLEDAGFDWKVLGPDVPPTAAEVNYISYQCDQDAYASTGQKCSAQSILFVHENWKNNTNLLAKMKALAQQRNLSDLTVGPVLTIDTPTLLHHIQKLLEIPGAELMWGGKELANHKIPEKYGALEPTAVYVPLDQLLKEEYYKLATTELFAPFQVITSYNDEELVLQALEKMSHHLTAAIVSNDVRFQTKMLAHTVNGTTYAGYRARTTGAPQNHWFGPAGDPRGAGIGTPEAIQLVWSCHREIIHDSIIPTSTWTQPKQS
jgi:1-pyrroline-5-carboxylate dehydrogenase